MQKIIALRKTDEPALPADATEQERVDAAVRWINRKVESTVHFGLLQIGYYLLNNFFDGSIEQALSRNPHKDHSFRKLCRRGDLEISSTHLVNSVKLVVQEKLLAGDAAFRKLAVSHKIALLTVTDPRQKRHLAAKAVEEKLSVRALTRHVQTLRARTTGEASADADAWSRRLRRTLDAAGRLLENEVIDGLSAVEAEKLDKSISELRRQLQGTLAGLRGIRSVAV